MGVQCHNKQGIPSTAKEAQARLGNLGLAKSQGPLNNRDPS